MKAVKWAMALALVCGMAVDASAGTITIPGLGTVTAGRQVGNEIWTVVYGPGTGGQNVAKIYKFDATTQAPLNGGVAIEYALPPGATQVRPTGIDANGNLSAVAVVGGQSRMVSYDSAGNYTVTNTTPSSSGSAITNGVVYGRDGLAASYSVVGSGTMQFLPTVVGLSTGEVAAAASRTGVTVAVGAGVNSATGLLNALVYTDSGSGYTALSDSCGGLDCSLLSLDYLGLFAGGQVDGQAGYKDLTSGLWTLLTDSAGDPLYGAVSALFGTTSGVFAGIQGDDGRVYFSAPGQSAVLFDSVYSNYFTGTLSGPILSLAGFQTLGSNDWTVFYNASLHFATGPGPGPRLDDPATTPVPEPATILTTAFGIAALVGRRRREAKKGRR